MKEMEQKINVFKKKPNNFFKTSDTYYQESWWRKVSSDHM